MSVDELAIAFLGASGSFSEQAAELHLRRTGRTARLLGAPSPASVLELLASGAAERAVLPIANTSTGLVRAALEALTGARLELVDEIVLPVRLELLSRRAGRPLERIARVASHPLALRQCAGTLARLLPGREQVEWSDTASAARALALGELDEDTAVLASAHAAARYGLAALAHDVHDAQDNRTFFAVLRRAGGAAVD